MTPGTDGALLVEPWALREDRLDLNLLARTESLFALSNGHIGVRGTLEEGEPHALPGTYLNSVHELRPLPYAEGGYGYPESGQTVINVTDGKLVRLLVDDEPFDVRYGRLRRHERVLDLRSGLLERQAEWESPTGQAVRVRTRRLVSFTQRSLLALSYEVTALDAPARVVLQSELVANEQLPARDEADPRVAAVLDAPLVAEEAGAHGARAHLLHRVRHSGIRLAAAMHNTVEAPGEVRTVTDVAEDWARCGITTLLEPGQTLRLVKLVSYGWSSQRSLPALRDQVAAALTAASATGWERLLAEQREYLDAFWDVADVEVDGDPELQQAVRFGMFHVLQAGARAERRPLPAKGLTGPGYDGHTFWDTDTFVLPVLARTAPEAARDALLWRHATLPKAQARARELGLSGAAFPWRTITGEECSGYWPAGTAAFHITADVADAAVRYLAATGDESFASQEGLELLVETARLWRSLGHHDLEGVFRIDGVTGPDEYSAIADNNVYTNLMAQRNLAAAADLASRHPEEAAALGADAEEMAVWRDAAARMHVPYDERLGVHPQSEGFTDHEHWDFDATEAHQYPLFLHFPYFQLYRKQVVKQADLLLAMHLCGSAFTDEQKRRNVAYYEPLTVRDSSLSACTQAVMAAEVGHLDLAFAHMSEAALMDLRDLHSNTQSGLHLAALAGIWISLVGGFGGFRDDGGELSFRPRLPRALDRICFGLRHRGRRLRVEVRHDEVVYLLRDEGPPLALRSDGELLSLEPGVPVTRPVTLPEPGEPPRSPRHREPLHRGRLPR